MPPDETTENNEFPGDDELSADVHSCLVNAIKQTRSDFVVKPSTIPSQPPLGADEGAWAIILQRFANGLRELSSVYAFYVHQPIYAEETLNRKFPAIVGYLMKKVVSQFRAQQS